MTQLKVRRIMTKTFSGKRQIREVIASMLISEILNPKEVWLVSAWVSNFDLLDNRSGAFDALNPGWGHRMLTFFEVLETMVDAGCTVNVVIKDHETNTSALHEIRSKLATSHNVNLKLSEELHVKGLLTKDALLSGSMNFTYSGTNRNDELMTLDRSEEAIADAFREFTTAYPMDKPTAEHVEESEEYDDEVYL